MSRNLRTGKSVEFGRVHQEEYKPSDMSIYDNRLMKKYMTPDSHAEKCPRCGATIRQITKLLEEIKHLRLEKQLKCAHCEAFGVIKSCKKCGALVRDFLTSGSSCRQEQYSKWVLEVKRVLTNILNSEMTCPHLDFTKKSPTNDELERLIQELRTPLGPKRREVKVRDLFDEDESDTDVASIIEKKLKDIKLGKSSEEDFSRPKIFEEEEYSYTDEIDQEKARKSYAEKTRDSIKEAQDAKEKEMEKRSKGADHKKVDDTGGADSTAKAGRDSRGELADKDVGVGKDVSSKSKISKGDLSQKEGVRKKDGIGHEEGTEKPEIAGKKDRVGKKEGEGEKIKEKGDGVRKREGEGAEKRNMAGKGEVAGKRDEAGKGEGAGKKEVTSKVEGGGKKDVAGKADIAGKKDVMGKGEDASKKNIAGKGETPGKKDIAEKDTLVTGKKGETEKSELPGKGKKDETERSELAGKDSKSGKVEKEGKSEDLKNAEKTGKKDKPETAPGKEGSILIDKETGKEAKSKKSKEETKKEESDKEGAKKGKKDGGDYDESKGEKPSKKKTEKDETEKSEVAGKDSKSGKVEKEGKSEDLKNAEKTGKKDKPETAPGKEGSILIDKETGKEAKSKKSKEETKKEESDKEGAKKGKKDGGDYDESKGEKPSKKKTEGDEKTGKGDKGGNVDGSNAKPEKGTTKGQSVPVTKKVDDSPTAKLLFAFINQTKHEDARLPMINKSSRKSSIKVIKKRAVVRKTPAPPPAPVEETNSNISTESGLIRRESERIIKGIKIVKMKRPQKQMPEPSLIHTVTRKTTKSSSPSTRLMPTKKRISTEVSGKPTFFMYQLSDPRFIENGYTKLPLNKTTRVMFLFKMIPTHLNRNWFDRHKGAGILYYDTGEKLAEIDEDGSGRWYYRNGVMALNYYKSEDDANAFRYLIYSSGENDKNGRKRPKTILGSFDYQGNGIVFDHCGNVRLKYNQTEGEVIDSRIGPPGRWLWHMLNEPPVLDQIYVEKHGNLPIDISGQKSKVASKGVEPQIKDTRVDVEFENFLKEKSKKTTTTFKACLIKDKTFQLNEAFSLHIISQEHIELIFRNGLTCLKLELGMGLDSSEIVDTEMTDLAQTFTPYDCELDPRTESVAHIKKVIAETKNQTKQMKRHLNPCLNPDSTSRACSPVEV